MTWYGIHPAISPHVPFKSEGQRINSVSNKIVILSNKHCLNTQTDLFEPETNAQNKI